MRIPADSSLQHFAKFIHREHLASVIGMFSFETFSESRYVALRFRGSVAIHFIGTAATS
jgi:hypothetical protein